MALPPRDGSVETTVSSSRQAPRTDWTALSVAVLAPLLIVHFTVVKPTTAWLDQMRRQVAQLESTIQDLHEATPDANRAACLMDALARQQKAQAGAQTTLLEAEQTLERIVKLERRLLTTIETLDHVELIVAKATEQAEALSSELQLESELIAERVAQQSKTLARADAAMSELAQVPARLESSIDRASRAAPAVAQVESLTTKLAKAEALTSEAIDRTDRVLIHQEKLVKNTERVEDARQALDSLAELEEKLNSPLMDLEASHKRLEGLYHLKEEVIARTEDLPDAFDTLELMIALSADMRQASSVLNTAQRLVADLVLLEPSLSRLAGVVTPVLKQDTVGMLGGSELRLVLRELRQRHAEARAGVEEAVASRPAEESVK